MVSIGLAMTKKEEPKFLISLNDIFRLLNQKKKIILSALFIFSLLSVLYILIDPIEFQSEASFREKGPKSANLSSSSLTGIIMGGLGNHENEAIATIKSRTLLKKTIEKLGLQAHIDIPGASDSYWHRLTSHIKADFARFRGLLRPVLSDVNPPFQIVEASYDGETPLEMKIEFKSDGGYFVFNTQDEKIGEGSFGIPFKNKDFRFTVIQPKENLNSVKPFHVTLLPLCFKTDCIINKLRIKSDDSDKNVLRISYNHPNRHQASKFINSLMESYQDHLKVDQQQQSSLQLDYLQQRQDETALYLAELMHKHAESLSEDLSSVGFADSKKEMEFLAENQQTLKAQLLANELEIKRLHNVLSGTCVYYNQYHGSHGDPYVINKILEQVRDLRQQRDSLQIALSKSSYFDPEKTKNSLHIHLDNLKEIRGRSKEIDSLIVAYSNNLEPNVNFQVFNDPKFLLKTWHENLFSNIPAKNSSEYDDWVQRKERFQFYLSNLKRLLGVHEKIVQERLVHQHNTEMEFQGINLATANELYVLYSRQLNTIDENIRHNEFLSEQIKDPLFEISSLSATLTDPVSQDIIVRASQLTLNLKDENNRSGREQERLQHELDLQKKFLTLHLIQTNQLLQLNRTLAEQKIFNLQNITLELIYQQISLLEKNQSDYIASRLENLEQEKAIIQTHLDAIHHDMSLLPQRWVAEKLIEQGVTTSELIVQEIAKMVEFKNISHKLELIQSAPIDSATPSLHPIPAGIMVKSILGAILGCIMAATWVLVQALKKGIPVSTSNLKQMDQQVVGSLSTDYQPDSKSPIKDRDLQTLRRLHNFFSEGGTAEKKGHLALLLEGEGADYSPDLSALFLRKGLKVITLSLSFNKAIHSSEPGLLQYLTGSIDLPVIHADPKGDRIEAGGFSRFSMELLELKRFKELIAYLQAEYDWIIATSQAPLESAEAENLADYFPCVGITLGNETLPQIHYYTKLQMENPDKKVGFIMTSEDDV
jgi:tyrosine-protein kinase Etk/Wzc